MRSTVIDRPPAGERQRATLRNGEPAGSVDEAAAARSLTPAAFRELVDHVSHDMRSPLCVIRDYASLLQDGLIGELSGEQLDAVSAVLSRADEMHLLIDALLTTARLADEGVSANPETFATNDLLAPLESRLRERSAARRIRFASQIEESLPAVRCDPAIARDVVVNLWWYAARRCRTGDELLLRIRRAACGRLAIGVLGPGGAAPEDGLTGILSQVHASLHTPAAEPARVNLALGIACELAGPAGGEIAPAGALPDLTGFELLLPVEDAAARTQTEENENESPAPRPDR